MCLSNSSDKFTTSPLLLFVYNRPEHTRRTLCALSQNDGSDNTRLIIYSDGVKTAADLDKVKQVREICREVTGFSSVKVIEREQNLGLSGNIISGVTDEINTYGSVIVLEDDIETAPGFLQFMNHSLTFYQNTNIFSISGYCPDIKLPQTYTYTTFTAPRISSWGWATWREKWTLVDWEMKYFDHFIRDGEKRKNFEAGGNDLSVMLLKQYIGNIDSWAVRFNYACYKNHNRVIYPVKSLIRNIGTDGSGTHMKSVRKYDTPITEKVDVSKFCPYNEINRRIDKKYREFYDVSLIRRIINCYVINKFILFFRG